MNKSFVPFLPPWVETGLQPAFYDAESGTVLQQTARMYSKVNQLTRHFNEFSADVTNEVNTFETTVNNEIDAFEKNVNDVVDDYIDKFNALHDYVYDYFDNLDVQEEINNKLDDMLEAGTLQEIIDEYLQIKGVLSFDDVADMVASTNLVDGSTAKTLGFADLNDGGGSFYKIVEDDSLTADGKNIISLGHDDLYAVKINNTINVREFGAVGDGSADDYAAIQYCVDTFPHHTLYFPDGEYKVSSPITVKIGNEYQVNFLLENNAKIGAYGTVAHLMVIGETTGTYNRYSEGNILTVNGGLFDGTNVSGSLIYTTNMRKQTRLQNINMINVSTIGIEIGRLPDSSSSSDSMIENINISGSCADDGSIGMKLEGTDNDINNIRISGCMTAFYIRGGGNKISTVHALASIENGTDTEYNKTICFHLPGGGFNDFVNVYADTFAKAFYLDADGQIINCNNLMVYWYRNSAGANNTIFYCNKWAYVKVTTGRYEFPASGSNMIYRMASGIAYNTRRYAKAKGLYKAYGCSYYNTSEDVDLGKDYNLNNENTNICGTNEGYLTKMTANAVYPLCIASSGAHQFAVTYYGLFMGILSVQLSDSGAMVIEKSTIINDASIEDKFYLVSYDAISGDAGRAYTHLGIKSTGSDQYHGIALRPLSFSLKNGGELYNIASTTAVTPDTVVTEININPA